MKIVLHCAFITYSVRTKKQNKKVFIMPIEQRKNNNNNVNNKRNFGDTSPEDLDSDQKLRKVGAGSVDPNAFNWDVLIRKMDELLDRKLLKVASKEDVSSISKELNCLRSENAELKVELATLKESSETLHNTVISQQKRLEMLERKTKRSSVIASGLTGGSYNNIKSEINDIFTNVMGIEVKSFFCTKLNKEGTRCCIDMNSVCDGQLVLQNSSKLKGTGKFFRRDLTASEDKCRYHIRNLRRACMKKSGINCKITGASITINGKLYYSSEDGTISAKDEESASYLGNILSEVNATFKVCFSNDSGELVSPL